MNVIVSLLAILLTVSLAGCSGTQAAATEPKTSVATVTVDDLEIELLTDSRLEVGMTPVYVKVTTTAGAVVKDATVKVIPFMSMSGGTGHSAPVIDTAGLTDDEYYRCDIVFSMPSGAMGTWSAKVSVNRPGMALPVVVTFDHLAVADTDRVEFFTVTDPGTSVTTKYVASLNFNAAPKVGLNPVVVTLHRRQDMMIFVPVDDAAFAFDPQMPSMGHGSPGSVNPTFTSSGRYEGALSFSMAGNWETTVTVTTAGAALGVAKFATSF